MKSTLAAVKRQRFPTRASRRVRGLFILGLGFPLNGTWVVKRQVVWHANNKKTKMLVSFLHF